MTHELEYTEEELGFLRDLSVNDCMALASAADANEWRECHGHPGERGYPYKLDFVKPADKWIPRIWDSNGEIARLITDEFRHLFEMREKDDVRTPTDTPNRF